MSSEHPRIAFIGGGNMARSIVGGLIASGHAPASIAVGEPSEEARARLSALGPLETGTDNEAVVEGAALVLLALKPQVLQQVATPLAPAIARSGAVVMSIAAGVTVAMLERWLGAVPVVRCMPNTPALLGVGAAGLFANAAVDDAGRALATRVMEAVGTVAWVKEEAQIDAVTAASGSGPAYFFLFMERMIEAAVAQGLDESTARTLVLQTALGAARMATEAGDPPAELRRQVTSPGGTTAAALEAFEAGGLGDLVADAMDAAAARAESLARELEG